MDQFVLHLLTRVAKRFRRVRLAWLLSAAWISLSIIVALMAYAGVLPSLRMWLNDPKNLLWVGLAFFSVLTVLWSICQFTYRDYQWIAARIEDRYPSLKQRLITVSQPTQDGESIYLRRSLIKETIQHGRVNDWQRTVSSTRMTIAWFFQFAALSLASTVAIAAFAKPLSLGLNNVPSELPEAALELIEVEPGNVEIERGTDVVVTARFPGSVPESAYLNATDQHGATSRTQLQRNLNDSVFGGYLRSIQHDFQYAVSFGPESLTAMETSVDGSSLRESPTYKITVFDYPALVRADATIDSPSYANQERRIVKDTRNVTVVEGSTLAWTCVLNKSVVTAELVDRNGEVTPLIASESEPLHYTASLEMNESKRWKLRLIDDKNRSTKFDEELAAKVLMNKPPEAKLARAQDVSVSPLQEVTIQATAQDDFGIHSSGFVFALSDAEPTEVVFEKGDAPLKKVSLSQMIDLESLDAKPDQLLSYYFWVEDLDREGSVRRVDGEMFFAEVRPYDEIFREGQSPPGESQPKEESENAKKAEEIAELQKQIISGTWNIVRNPKARKQLDTFTADIQVLSDSQSETFTQTDAMEEEIRDPKSLEYLEQVREAMTSAIELLNAANEKLDHGLLQDALRSERKAYEGLLRLRAREHEIVQSQKPNQSKSSQSASQQNRQQQIDQLKLDEEENRYETEQQAAEAEPAAQREMRQVMNRLEELARRQKDLNEQLKELETAIQEAESNKDEEKAKELEEELKRLRDNQQELLRDSDELLDRMQQSQESQDAQSQETMQQAREQMEQARSELQKSVESLSEGKPAPAISSGTRAERQMEETREELRQSSANQLEQTVRSLLQNAQELDSQQQKLQESLSAADQNPESDTANPNDPSKDNSATPLRPEGTSQEPNQANESTRQQWTQQQEKLDKLLEQMQETVTEAESSEPLLAEELYESFRESKQSGIAQGMQQVPTLLDRGLDEPAKEIGAKIAEGVRELRESIEQASEKIIGSEQASLRRALSELNQAKKQIEAEVNRNHPQNQSNPEATSQAAGDAETTDNANQPDNKSADAQPTEKPNSPQAKQDSPNDPQQAQGKPSDSPTNQESSQPGSEPGKQSNDQSGNESSQQSQGQSQARGQGQAEGEGQGQARGQAQGQRRGQNDRGQSSGAEVGGGLEQLGRNAADSSPITGDDFSKWTDALRDVEELVSDPEMKADAARIREAAREMRIDYARHSKDPQWPLVRKLIVQPLDQLREKVQEALLRSSAERNAIVPVDRDPLPSNYQQQVDKYYENLGSDQKR